MRLNPACNAWVCLGSWFGGFLGHTAGVAARLHSGGIILLMLDVAGMSARLCRLAAQTAHPDLRER